MSCVGFGWLLLCNVCRYSELDQEMEEIGHLWRAAKSDFAGFPPSIPIDQVRICYIHAYAYMYVCLCA